MLKRREKKISNFTKSNPFLPPFEPGLFIQNLTETHRLIFNKFMISEDHVLVIPRIYEDQNSLLTLKDFEATVLAMNTLDGFAFYNYNKIAGASQKHKHL